MNIISNTNVIENIVMATGYTAGYCLNDNYIYTNDGPTVFASFESHIMGIILCASSLYMSRLHPAILYKYSFPVILIGMSSYKIFSAFNKKYN